MTSFQSIILASSSPYRRDQLNQLGFPFIQFSPNIDETAKFGESAKVVACRLAKEKAYCAQIQHPNAIIIASDQVAELEGKQLGKPLSTSNARKQLKACSGKPVTFYTSLCVMHHERTLEDCTSTEVLFRELSSEAIDAYIKKDRPLHCAGSFKCESLGIALFETITSDDPTALIGLPLLSVNRFLLKLGFDLLHPNCAS